jgi:hypothetical protein
MDVNRHISSSWFQWCTLHKNVTFCAGFQGIHRRLKQRDGQR